MLGIKRDPDAGSDSDEDAMGPRMDIDLINLVSEDEDDEDDDAGPRAGPSRATRARRVDGTLPIRLQRREHTDRVVKINTEASSDAAAALRKQAEATTKAGQASNMDEALTKVTRKAKSRTKDLELVGDRRRWKGVWEDDVDDEPVRIKEEPTDEPMNLGVERGVSEFGTALAHEQTPELAPEPTDDRLMPDHLEDSKAHVRTRLKQRRRATDKPTMYQTAEEIKEWEKRQEELASMAQELGRINLTASDDSNAPGTDGRDPSATANAREEAVYLFQLPTILPELSEPLIKAEPVSPTLGRQPRPAAASTSASTAPVSEEIQIKMEDAELAGNLDASRRRNLNLAPGLAGKLHVHKSGRSTLTWGGTKMEVKMGVSPYFLQTAILTQLEKDEPPRDKSGRPKMRQERRKEGMGGQAVSFGQIRGKLVVMPAWTEILGERGLA